jgi:urease accessory protein
MRVLFPDQQGDRMPSAVLANTAGGLVGGDRIEVDASAGAGAALCVTTQAAEKVYRSAGENVDITTTLRALDGAWIEWLPNETILFERARLRRRIEIELAESAASLAVEMQVFGRIARGERLTTGLLHDSWRIRRCGRLVWADALRIDGDIAAILDRPACFGGAAALATIVCAVPNAARWIDPIRAMLGATSPLAATCVNGLVLLRGLAREPQSLRAELFRIVPMLRAELGGWPARMPVSWAM